MFPQAVSFWSSGPDKQNLCYFDRSVIRIRVLVSWPKYYNATCRQTGEASQLKIIKTNQTNFVYLPNIGPPGPISKRLFL